MARPLPRGARRSLTTGETLLAAIGPNPAQLVRRGPSPRRAEALEREWVRWDAEFGFAWRVAAGISTAPDRDLLDAGEQRANSEPPDPPGFRKARSDLNVQVVSGRAQTRKNEWRGGRAG